MQSINLPLNAMIVLLEQRDLKLKLSDQVRHWVKHGHQLRNSPSLSREPGAKSDISEVIPW